MQSNYSELPNVMNLDSAKLFAQELSTADAKTPDTILTRIRAWFIRSCDVVFGLLFMDGNTEPRITQLQGRDGDYFWEIHDVRSGKTIYCMTEDEVMGWLDSRQYRQ
ncbi:MAG: hypothetical protein NW220_23340 [Leptolyngbyaceae cyanobacterium bins.349]|nr:hypothetical protein [Leptolyngbyaceae cyanobacterium bins.349]